MRTVFSIILLCACISSFGANPRQFRFHCEKDTIKINNLIKEGKESGITNSGDLTHFYANKLLDTPYVGHTLEGDVEYLTINIDELDCTTFIETLVALVKTTTDGRENWRDYANNLENIRYRRGDMNGYPSRLHYISDWVMDNTNRGNVKEVTSYFNRSSHIVKTLDFMTSHRDSYPALKEDEVFNQIKNVEIGYRSHKFPFLKKTYLMYKDVKSSFKNGDIIALVTQVEGLDVAHMGIITIIDSTPYLLHASSLGKKVMVDKKELHDMLRTSKTNTGIRVIRIAD